MAYEKLYELIGWKDRPSRETLVSRNNLGKMDDAINALDDRIVEMSKAMTPVNNLLATEPGSPLDATMGKTLNDKIETLGGFTPVIDETTGKITGYKTKAGADTVFPFSGEKTALLALDLAPLTKSNAYATISFENEDYFQEKVCVKACSGTLHLRYRPARVGDSMGTITFEMFINDEIIYSITDGASAGSDSVVQTSSTLK